MLIDKTVTDLKVLDGDTARLSSRIRSLYGIQNEVTVS